MKRQKEWRPEKVSVMESLKKVFCLLVVVMMGIFVVEYE
jgi:hypothetical protein